MPCLAPDTPTVVVVVTVDGAGKKLTYQQLTSADTLPKFPGEPDSRAANPFQTLASSKNIDSQLFDSDGNFEFLDAYPHRDCYNIFFFLNDARYEFYERNPIEYWGFDLDQSSGDAFEPPSAINTIRNCGGRVTPYDKDSYQIEAPIVYRHYIQSAGAYRSNLIGFTYHGHTTVSYIDDSGTKQDISTPYAWYRLVLKKTGRNNPVCIDDPGGHNGDHSSPTVTVGVF
jgi:hypothetical protein